MTEREICEKIVQQKSCEGIFCYANPLQTIQCPHHLCGKKNEVVLSQQWLDEHPEFQKGEIILVRFDKKNIWSERIFLYMENNKFVCVALTFNEVKVDAEYKQKFLSNDYNDAQWNYAKKLDGEIVKPEPEIVIKKESEQQERVIDHQTHCMIEKIKSTYSFFKEYIIVYLEIDYNLEKYTLKSHKNSDFIFQSTDRFEQNIILIDLMLEATKFAKKELVKNE
ncbi:MAG: hypothetical protein WC389_03530 [Lutibacter sp.]|jgi:hypothetical protein